MKTLLTALIVSVAAVGMAPTEADARRLGGGGGMGMQRSLPARTPPAALPAKPAQTPAASPATAGAPAAAAAAAPRRSWMAPLAGLAAGLGLAALMSHLGLGAEFANMIMMVLLAIVAFVAIRFLLRRFGPNAGASQPRVAAAGGAGTPGMQFKTQADAWAKPASTPALGSTGAPAWSGSGNASPSFAAEPVATASALPADFDRDGFERIAKMIFIRMQAANDAGDLNDLRQFTTPELFAAARLELQERGSQRQQTDVVKVDAEVLEVATEAERQVVSVRFHGLIREELDGVANPFDEVWHLVRPLDGSREWAIAGIQQMA